MWNENEYYELSKRPMPPWKPDYKTMAIYAATLLTFWGYVLYLAFGGLR